MEWERDFFSTAHMVLICLDGTNISPAVFFPDINGTSACFCVRESYLSLRPCWLLSDACLICRMICSTRAICNKSHCGVLLLLLIYCGNYPMLLAHFVGTNIDVIAWSYDWGICRLLAIVTMYIFRDHELTPYGNICQLVRLVEWHFGFNIRELIHDHQSSGV